MSEQDKKAAREQLASWLIKRSIPTGHGDTFDDLMEAALQKERERVLEEAAKICEQELTPEETMDWEAFDGGFELWLAKKFRALASQQGLTKAGEIK